MVDAATDTAPHVTLDDWQLRRAQVIALVRSYVAYVRTSGLSCFDLACLKPVPPRTFGVWVNTDRPASRVHPINSPPPMLAKLARIGAVLVPLWGLAFFASEEWSIWLILFSATVAAILVPILIQILVFAIKTRHLSASCEIPEPVRAFLLSTRLRLIAQKDEVMRPYSQGIGLLFTFIGGPMIDRLVAEQAAEFANKLAEAAAEQCAEKLIESEIERMSEALIAETDAWLDQTYNADAAGTVLKQLGFADLHIIDLRVAKAAA
jgi:hypothetical protein